MTVEAKGVQQDVPDRRVTTASAVMPSHSRGRDHANSFVKRYRTEIAASSSSVFSTLAAFPLDSVKTRMQTYQYRGFIDCVKQTYRTEHLAGFFRGEIAMIYALICNPHPLYSIGDLEPNWWSSNTWP